MNRSKNALRVVLLAAVSAMVLIALALIKHRSGSATTRLTLSALQAVVGLVWVGLLAWWSWSEQDEMERRVMTEAGAIAFLVTAGVSLVVGFLADAAVATPNWEYVYAMLTVLWALAYGLVSARYR